MTTYIDSSVLVAVYVPERFSKAARKAVRDVPQVPFTQLHELEVPNAFELLVGRIWKGYSQAQVTSHERTPPDFSLGAWICCMWQRRK